MILTVLLTVLILANLFLFFALAYSGRRAKDTETRIGFAFMAAVLVFDVIFLIGGATLW